MTQEALALRSGVTRNVLIDVEHGKRGILYERLVDIADALDVPVGDPYSSPNRKPRTPRVERSTKTPASGNDPLEPCLESTALSAPRGISKRTTVRFSDSPRKPEKPPRQAERKSTEG
jgi:transcriptional regulator with XRE-family HTH domain